MRRIHGVEDILLGFEPKDAGSIPAGSVFSKNGLFGFDIPKMQILQIRFSGKRIFLIADILTIQSEIRYTETCQWGKSFQERLCVKKMRCYSSFFI